MMWHVSCFYQTKVRSLPQHLSLQQRLRSLWRMWRSMFDLMHVNTKDIEAKKLHTHTYTHTPCFGVAGSWSLSLKLLSFPPQVFPRAAFIMFILAKRWTGMKCGLYGAVLCRHKDGWDVKCWRSGVVWLMIKAALRGCVYEQISWNFHQFG